jgi:selenophosphate synthase
VISTAIKKKAAQQPWIDAAIASMTTLNKKAAEVISGGVRMPGVVTASVVTGDSPVRGAPSSAIGGVAPGLRPGQPQQSSAASDGRPNTNDHFAVHAMTDVTGFGMIGHAREIALASSVSLRFRAHRIPLLEGALHCVRAGHIPGGLKANREFAECVVGYEDGISDEMKTILFDPQTAGGLLISVAPEDAAGLMRALTAAGVPAVEIGEVLSATKPLIAIVP